MGLAVGVTEAPVADKLSAQDVPLEQTKVLNLDGFGPTPSGEPASPNVPTAETGGIATAKVELPPAMATLPTEGVSQLSETPEPELPPLTPKLATDKVATEPPVTATAEQMSEPLKQATDFLNDSGRGPRGPLDTDISSLTADSESSLNQSSETLPEQKPQEQQGGSANPTEEPKIETVPPTATSTENQASENPAAMPNGMEGYTASPTFEGQELATTSSSETKGQTPKELYDEFKEKLDKGDIRYATIGEADEDLVLPSAISLPDGSGLILIGADKKTGLFQINTGHNKIFETMIRNRIGLSPEAKNKITEDIKEIGIETQLQEGLREIADGQYELLIMDGTWLRPLPATINPSPALVDSAVSEGKVFSIQLAGEEKKWANAETKSDADNKDAVATSKY